VVLTSLGKLMQIGGLLMRLVIETATVKVPSEARIIPRVCSYNAIR
jgi:hypothetical protein